MATVVFEFKLPDIGEGIAEAEIVAWHVKVGDTIAEDQQIADMMTDKATVEMEIAGGRQGRRRWPGKSATRSRSDRCLTVIETAGRRRPRKRTVRPKTAKDEAPARRRRGRKATPREQAGTNSGLRGRGSRRAKPRRPAPVKKDSRGLDPSRHKASAHVLASPAVRATRPRPRHRPRASENGERPHPPRRPRRFSFSTTAAPCPPRPAAPRAQTRAIKIVGLRRKIAENMQEAKRRIPHFTLVEEFRRHRARGNPGDDERTTAAINPNCRPPPSSSSRWGKALRRLADAQRDLRRRCGWSSPAHGAMHLGMATQTGTG